MSKTGRPPSPRRVCALLFSAPAPAPPRPFLGSAHLPKGRRKDKPIADDGQHARHGEVAEGRLGQIENQEWHGDGDDHFYVCVVVGGGVELEPFDREKGQDHAQQLWGGQEGEWEVGVSLMAKDI